LDELILAKRAGKGDKNALKTLLSMNYKIVFGYLLKITMNQELAEDLTQETMVKAIKAIKTFKGRSKFSTWLISIASNAAKDHFRKSSKKKTSELHDNCIPSTQSIEEDYIENEKIALVIQELNKLPEVKRIPFVLKHYYNYSYEEIAHILDCPTGTVRSRIHYCIKELQSKFKGGL